MSALRTRFLYAMSNNDGNWKTKQCKEIITKDNPYLKYQDDKILIFNTKEKNISCSLLTETSFVFFNYFVIETSQKADLFR